MKRKTIKLSGATACVSILEDRHGQWMQCTFSIVPDAPQPFQQQLSTMLKAEAAVFEKFGIAPETILFRRFFSSDLINHREDLLAYKQSQTSDFFYSLTEQPPVPAVKLALLGLCLANITEKVRDEELLCCNTTSGIRHLFIEHLTDPDPDGDVGQQTDRIFARLRDKLSAYNATIEDHVLRTWIYAPHVDADYPGIVKARRELFDTINLTEDTHYIASTGIQGGTGNQYARVSMDAYAVTGIDKASVRYIHAPEYLSPTHVYGVTFERATAVAMGKTDFLFISGTASIDHEGQVVHIGDVANQTRRTLTNISALLEAGGFGSEDLTSFIVYLRDASDYATVRPIIDEYASSLPTVYVHAPVCRPQWLIEIEATAGRFVD